jgi:hypothetical protein
MFDVPGTKIDDQVLNNTKQRIKRLPFAAVQHKVSYVTTKVWTLFGALGN